MKITKIRRLVSFGMHENISLEADIEDGETVKQVDSMLRQKIKDLINSDNERKELFYDVEILLRQKKIFEDNIAAMRIYIDKNEAALKKAGFLGEYITESDIPF